MKRILVTGAAGQIGSELTMALRERYGGDNVVAGGRKTKPSKKLLNSGPFEVVDCLDAAALADVVRRYKVDTIYHLAAILSAVAEADPALAWQVNINGLYNVLEVAREHGCALFVPSSIGAFGGSTPLDDTPQDTIQRPSTMYGVTKVAGELLCDYYTPASVSIPAVFVIPASSPTKRFPAAGPRIMQLRFITKPSNIKATPATFRPAPFST